jgi:hypothetical protein
VGDAGMTTAVTANAMRLSRVSADDPGEPTDGAAGADGPTAVT